MVGVAWYHKGSIRSAHTGLARIRERMRPQYSLHQDFRIIGNQKVVFGY